MTTNCPTCRRRGVLVAHAESDLIRIARSAGRYRDGPPPRVIDQITEARAYLVEVKEVLRAHEAECPMRQVA